MACPSHRGPGIRSAGLPSTRAPGSLLQTAILTTLESTREVVLSGLSRPDVLGLQEGETDQYADGDDHRERVIAATEGQEQWGDDAGDGGADEQDRHGGAGQGRVAGRWLMAQSMHDSRRLA